MHTPQAELRYLQVKKDEIIEFLAENAEFLDPFYSTTRGILISEGGAGGAKPVSDGTEKFNATTTAYTLYYASQILSTSKQGDLPRRIHNVLENTINKYLSAVTTKFLEDHKSRATTAVGKLPTNYNTTIQLAGILYSAEMAGVDLAQDIKNYISNLVGGIRPSRQQATFVTQIKELGFIHRMGSSIAEPIPSAYHTYWALESIKQLEKHGEIFYSTIYEPLAEWALDTLAKSISLVSAGMVQSFDPIEVSYLQLILLSLLADSTNLGDEKSIMFNAKRLVQHSIKIIFTEYFHNGLFSKSLPVLADTQNYSLSCPTVEPVSLLITKHPEYFAEYTEQLLSLYNWIKESRVKLANFDAWGWRSEWEHYSSKPTSFMSVSVITFLVGLQSLLDDLLASKAGGILGLRQFKKDPDTGNIAYPGALGDIIANYVVGPVHKSNRKLAHLSIIFFGPPGTAKTTISKKISHDLEWPLLVINASEFMKSGMERIDFEAERIFSLVSHLKDVVVLFDEIEELVLNRDGDTSHVADQQSRLLTTSMLPRINDLRSTGRIVFIFATNYLQHIDKAIARTGRFDIVHCVMPPSKEERQRIIESLLTDKTAPHINTISTHLKTQTVAERTERFCYADLRDMVKRILIESSKRDDFAIKQEIDMIINNEINVGSGSLITPEDYVAFKVSKSKLDRPNPNFNAGN